MKKYFGLFFILLVLFACSRVGDENVKEKQDLTFEDEIIKVMEDNQAKVDNIIDFDLKDNHIIVTYEKAGEDFLYVAIIKQTN
ncbi:hypothetical protein E3U55_17090, partial [Filobacillus milosensis]